MDNTDHIEWFEERAAIMEFDGGLDRDAANKAAYFDWRAHNPGIPAPEEIVRQISDKFRKSVGIVVDDKGNGG